MAVSAAPAAPVAGEAASGLAFARHRAAFADAHGHRLVAIRRWLHAHPELAWQERRTRDMVRRILGEQGLEPTLQHRTALVYDVATGGGDVDGPTIALRADMDALPIQDEKRVAYRSTAPGVAHACGHDVHTAALVGVALLLRTTAHLLPPGRVRLIFQPAEETLPGGAQRLTCTAGVMNGVDAIFALHCDPGLPTGTIGVREGPITSACDQVRIALDGPGGHTARPQLTTDLVHVTSLVAARVPLLVAQMASPSDPPALVFGSVHAGVSHNVIPTTSELLGTVRTRTRAAWEAAPGLVADALRHTTSGFAVGCTLEQTRGAPPVENDAHATELAELACRAVAGATIRQVEQSMGAEDFSWYLTDVPGCYMRLGVGAGSGPAADLHSGTFDADEAAIPFGAQVLASVLQAALAAPPTRRG